MVIFGVTGDLARKKLLPAIYDLANRGLLPAGFTLVGYGRRDWSKADFEDYIKEAVKAGARTPFRDNVWERLAEGMVFVSGNFDDDAAFDQLAATLSELMILVVPPGTGRFTCRFRPPIFRTCATNCSVPAWLRLRRRRGGG